MLFQLVNVMKRDLYWMNINMPLVLTMEDVLVKVPILLGINVINVLQVLKKFLIYHFCFTRGEG